MSGMRLVGLLMLGLGLLIAWEVLNGRRPQDHLQQLIDLFGHQHVAGRSAAPRSSPATVASGGSAGLLVP